MIASVVAEAIVKVKIDAHIKAAQLCPADAYCNALIGVRLGYVSARCPHCDQLERTLQFWLQAVEQIAPELMREILVPPAS